MSDLKYRNIGLPAMHLIEECGEVLQAICKGERFGWDNYHPDRLPRQTNLQDLENEILDIVEAFGDFKKSLTKKEIKMGEFKKYTRKGFLEMRPYIPNEDMSNVSVADVDTPEEGGMVARNPKNHEDQRYVAKQYFEDNLELAE